MNNGNKQENLNSIRGFRVQVARKQAGMTQSELAEKAGFANAEYISQMENGRKRITDENISRFAEVLNVPAEWLRCETDNPFYIDNEIDDYDSFVSIRSMKHDISKRDKTLFDLLSFCGYDISFRVMIYNHDEKTKLYETVDFEQLRACSDREFPPFETFFPSCAVILNDGSIHECIIGSVVINGHNITLKDFGREISRLLAFIDFHMDNCITDNLEAGIIAGFDE